MDGKPKAKKDDDPLAEFMLDLSKVKEKQRQPLFTFGQAAAVFLFVVDMERIFI